MKMPVWSLPGFVDGNSLSLGGINAGYDDVIGTNRYGFGQYSSYPIAYYNSKPILLWDNGTPGSLSYLHLSLFDVENPKITLPKIVGVNPSTGQELKPGDINPGGSGEGAKAPTTGGAGWTNVATSGIQFGGAVANSYAPVKDANEMYAESGLSTGYGTGYTYLKQNSIDGGALKAELKKLNIGNISKTVGAGAAFGGAIGSLFTPVGGLIGAAAGAILGGAFGWMGASSRKRRLEKAIFNALMDVRRLNAYNNASAQTDYLGLNYYKLNGSTQDDALYSAKYGKDVNGWTKSRTRAMDYNRKLSLPNSK